MRIAIVGSHGTGKSTLLAELSRLIPKLTVVEEAYYRLLDAGQGFSDPPTVADFESLFEASIGDLAEHYASPVAFDRSPADYLAYLVALQPGAALVDHVASAAAALETLDLVVYVPIERPDRIAVPELPRLRRRVDDVLREMFIDQSWGWTLPVLEVSGSAAERAAQVHRAVQLNV
jgi:hypothetical protein